MGSSPIRVTISENFLSQINVIIFNKIIKMEDKFYYLLIYFGRKGSGVTGMLTIAKDTEEARKKCIFECVKAIKIHKETKSQANYDIDRAKGIKYSLQNPYKPNRWGRPRLEIVELQLNEHKALFTDFWINTVCPKVSRIEHICNVSKNTRTQDPLRYICSSLK
jgi:hypothetical protein